MWALTLLALSLLAAHVTAQSTLTFNTPDTMVECQPVLLTWGGGQAPYHISVLPGGQINPAPLQDFGTVDETTLTWVVNLTAGTAVTLTVVDSTGASAYSATITVGAGSSDACLTGASSSLTSVAATYFEGTSAGFAPVSAATAVGPDTLVSEAPTLAYTPTVGTTGVETTAAPSFQATTLHTSSAAPAGAPANNGGAGKSLSTGAIAGIAVGTTMGGIVIGVLLVWFCCRRSLENLIVTRRFREEHTADNVDLAEAQVVPFVTGAAHTRGETLANRDVEKGETPATTPGLHQATWSDVAFTSEAQWSNPIIGPSSTDTGYSSAAMTTKPALSFQDAPTVTSSPSEVPLASEAQSSATIAGSSTAAGSSSAATTDDKSALPPQRTPTVVNRHEDAGRAPRVLDLPPLYNANWADERD